MELKPEDILSMQHKGWLDHPVTKQFIDILDKHKEYLVTQMASNSFTRSAEDHKMSAVSIGTVTNIKKYATNTEQFIKQLTQ